MVQVLLARDDFRQRLGEDTERLQHASMQQINLCGFIHRVYGGENDLTRAAFTLSPCPPAPIRQLPETRLQNALRVFPIAELVRIRFRIDPTTSLGFERGVTTRSQRPPRPRTRTRQESRDF